MDKYFLRFPLISYNNTAILDLSRRVKIENADYKIPNLFYPVEITAGLRPDVLADAYYKDAEQDWIIYLSNQTVDPYYQWYLNDQEFASYIQDKYGDIATPTQKIKFWRNNWSSDDTILSPDYYQNNLSLEQKQYYAPNFGPGSKVISYQRKPVDWTTNTNRIDQYNITTPANDFIVGELVDIHAGSSNQAIIQGQAEVVTSNSSVLILQNITGNAFANTSWNKTFVGNVSFAMATSNNVVNLSTNISNNDVMFWESVSYYTWENERNEQRKTIQLLNPSLTRDTSNKIRALLNS